MKLFVYKVIGNEIYDDELKTYYNKIDIVKREQIKNYVDSFNKSKCFMAHLIVYLYYKGNINYKYNSKGKILNTNNLDGYFNISYSSNYVVVIFNDSEIGIDIEKINQITKKELEYYASNVEKKIFKNKFEYTKLWCLKESYLKYLGSGITENLKNIEFQKNGEKYTCKNNKELYIDVFHIDENYICAVITNKIKQMDIEFIDINKIKEILITNKNI